MLAIPFGNAANAADVGRPYPPLLESAPLLVDEFGSNWYLRGDIGYRWNETDSVTNNDPPPRVRDNDLGNSWMFGAGVGYKWEWFRADLTVDYGSKSHFLGDAGLRTNDFTAKIDSVTGLVNIYGDLGTWYGLTPYVGAGIGFAHLRAANFEVASAQAPAVDSATKWNFAWAFMAGVSYKVYGNYNIDLGYRHVNMGDVKTGRDEFDNQLAFKKMSADEIRLGFRYVLD
jgi:opacity protein-like surface antigen